MKNKIILSTIVFMLMASLLVTTISASDTNGFGYVWNCTGINNGTADASIDINGTTYCLLNSANMACDSVNNDNFKIPVIGDIYPQSQLISLIIFFGIIFIVFKIIESFDEYMHVILKVK